MKIQCMFKTMTDTEKSLVSAEHPIKQGHLREKGCLRHEQPFIVESYYYPSRYIKLCHTNLKVIKSTRTKKKTFVTNNKAHYHSPLLFLLDDV